MIKTMIQPIRNRTLTRRTIETQFCALTENQITPTVSNLNIPTVHNYSYKCSCNYDFKIAPCPF